MKAKLVDFNSIQQQNYEDELVTAAQQGDVQAFEQLYRLFEKRIYALCMRMLANESLAEELLQEAFIKAWRAIGSFKGDSKFGTWMYRLTSNLIISYFRSQKKGVHDSDWLDSVSGPDEVHRVNVQSDLESALRELPERARMVIVLHDIEGYAHHEISDMMGIAVGTSKAQLHRARNLLTEWFNDASN